MICFDREFPESARILMLKGAELILTPNACELEANRIGQFRTRAFENMLGMAMANYAIPQENGHSVAFDGIAFDENRFTRYLPGPGGRPRGHLPGRVRPGPAAGLPRSTKSGATPIRKPGRYGILTSPAVEPPFVRPNARR